MNGLKLARQGNPIIAKEQFPAMKPAQLKTVQCLKGQIVETRHYKE